MPRTECTSIGEGRAIVALWLAAQSSPKAAAALRRVAAANPYGTLPMGNPDLENQMLFGLADDVYRAVGESEPMSWGSAEAEYALQLLDRPEATVRQLVAARWGELASPTTTTDQAVRILGLRPLPTWDQVLIRTGSHTAGQARRIAANVRSSMEKQQCR